MTTDLPAASAFGHRDFLVLLLGVYRFSFLFKSIDVVELVYECGVRKGSHLVILRADRQVSSTIC